MLEIGSICKPDIIISELTVRKLTDACTFLPCGKSRRVGLQRRLGWRLLLRRRKRISPRPPPRRAGGKGWGFRSSRGCTWNRCNKSGPAENATQYVTCLWRTFPRLLYQNCPSYLESQTSTYLSHALIVQFQEYYIKIARLIWKVNYFTSTYFYPEVLAYVFAWKFHLISF